MTTVKFFGKISEPMGTQVSLEIPPAGLAVRDLRDALAEAFGCEDIRHPSIRAAINETISTEADCAMPQDDIAFLSPLSGG